ncbi:MAG: ribose 5-phosphate isomerase B [Chloroflexi bacterium]|nr:ribose 5-phosphate isomerase B [Chloroflexota bacterium]
MRIALGCDHQGVDLKNELIGVLQEMGHETKDFGCYDKSSVDWPDIAAAVGKAVSHNECQHGILICGTGIGMSIGANKVRGIRAARCQDTFSARLCREHNDANVLCMGAWIVGPRLAQDLVKTFLETPYEGGRHQRRLDKVKALEEGWRTAHTPAPTRAGDGPR